MNNANEVLNWILTFDGRQVPEPVLQQAKRCLLDLLGVAASATQTQLAHIGEQFVLSQYPGDRPLLFAQGHASQTGAALFGGWLIDSVDAHDGHVLTKGHSGVALLPSLLATPHSSQLSGRDFLVALIIGYEVSIRAGIALHASTTDYHTSGAWNAVGVAAMVGRVVGLDLDQLNHALGIAEFYGPRSPMMRCIEHPTMLKDGSGWGAMTGIASVEMARLGFTGAPALTLSSPQMAGHWSGLNERWCISEQYFKRYPVCYWAQPAVEAVLSVGCAWSSSQLIARIEVETFHEARCLHVVYPESTEQAQYSLPWAVASALYRRTVDYDSITTDLSNPEVQDLSRKVVFKNSKAFDDLFPKERWARVRIFLIDGRSWESKPCQAKGIPQNPLSDQALHDKYQMLAGPVLGDRAVELESVVDTLEDRNASDLFSLLGLPDNRSMSSDRDKRK